MPRMSVIKPQPSNNGMLSPSDLLLTTVESNGCDETVPVIIFVTSIRIRRILRYKTVSFAKTDIASTVKIHSSNGIVWQSVS